MKFVNGIKSDEDFKIGCYDMPNIFRLLFNILMNTYYNAINEICKWDKSDEDFKIGCYDMPNIFKLLFNILMNTYYNDLEHIKSIIFNSHNDILF